MDALPAGSKGRYQLRKHERFNKDQGDSEQDGRVGALACRRAAPRGALPASEVTEA